MTKTSPLMEIAHAQKRDQNKGIASICSANPWVLKATLQNAKNTGEPVLIESTCNQVNQYGGYTGWTPSQFVAYLKETAAGEGFPFEQISTGGDHLGPGPWQDEPVAVAMEKAKVLVRDYVRAGYSKIHLDASMRCADDDPNLPLDTSVSASRAAELAAAAEDAFSEQPLDGSEPYYVIGTEVPLPGGTQEGEEALTVTKTENVAATIEAAQEAFVNRGLGMAWQRVIAVVVQPGVEYGDDSLFEYDRAQADGLARFIEGEQGLIYEAHSTDYQRPEALRQLVEDHFAILKVGPALTYALREGVFGLASIEEELLTGKSGSELSQVRERLDEAMLANPVYWQKYYQGDAQALLLARKYSLSDRSRYYWPVSEVQTALSRLLQNLEERPMPMTLLSQYLPLQYARIRNGELKNKPSAILVDKVKTVLSDYSYACGYLPDPAGNRAID